MHPEVFRRVCNLAKLSLNGLAEVLGFEENVLVCYWGSLPAPAVQHRKVQGGSNPCQEKKKKKP